MKLTPQEIQLFKNFGSAQKEILKEYFERLKFEILDPQTLNKENVEARAEAIKILQDKFVNRILLINEDKKSNPNEYI